MTNSTEEFQRPWSKFLGWFFVGVLWMAGIGSILSIGLIILALAAVATWFMLRQPASRRDCPPSFQSGHCHSSCVHEEWTRARNRP
jgi:hypothetical protein